MIHHLLRSAFSNDAATVDAGTGADVDHVVRQANSIFVMLHDNHRVTDITQVPKGVQQPIVVALMQANRRFVEDIHDAHQTRADLASKANTLGFTARQGIRAAIQRQIVQANVDQELQAFADLLEDFVGDFATAPRELQPTEVVSSIADRQIGHRR